MIRFVARRSANGKLVVGLVLFPDDIGNLLSGTPELTTLDDIEAGNPVVESIVIHAFRDLGEFQDAMKQAGVDPRTIDIEPMPDGSKLVFRAPPKNKIGDN